MIKLISDYLIELQKSETWDKELEYTVWKDTALGSDLSCTCCTHSARLIAHKFGGSVYGYHIPSRFTEDIIAYWCGGHDFAIVGHYLIDYWAHYINNPAARPILSIKDAKDFLYITEHYLPLKYWERVPIIIENI